MGTQQMQRNPDGLAVKAALHPSIALQPHFELLSKQIQQWALGREAPVAIGVTGILPQSGTSTVSFNLASELAKSTQYHVLLIEANFGHPFAVKPDPQNRGLSDLLRATVELDSCVIPTPIQNLFLLSAGSQDETTATNLPFDCFSPLIREQLGGFHYLVFDLPSLDEFNASLPMACQMDGLIIVADARQIDRSRMAYFRQKLDCQSAKIIGVVINKSN
jgi:Mrp family chromosome partitioning ATPase